MAVEHLYVVTPLESTPNGSPVEVIYAGTFHLADRGKVLELTEAQIDEMVQNFADLGDAGRVPINVNHHGQAGTLDEARAVGWVVGLEKVATQDGARLSLMATPQWLEDARESIAAGEFKFLSAEIVFHDSDYKSGREIGCHLRGIALTNTPAIPDLTPITLARRGTPEHLGLKLQRTLEAVALNDSLMERVQAVAMAFFRAFWDTESESYDLLDVREDDVICRACSPEGAHLFRVTYALSQAGVLFAPKERWVEVRQVYEDVGGTAPAADASPAPGAAALPQAVVEGGTAANTGTEVNAAAKVAPALPSAADSGTTQAEESNMDKLRELLGLGADGDVHAAVAALQAQIATLTGERDAAQAALAQAQAAGQEGLSAHTAEVEKLTTQVSAYEAEAQRLAAQVEELSQARRQRATDDRIALALRDGRATPAELDAEDGYLRKLAAEQPEIFDRIMKIRQPRPDLFHEEGNDGSAPQTSIDKLFALVDEVAAANPAMDRADVRRQVLAEHPEFAKLQYEEGK